MMTLKMIVEPHAPVDTAKVAALVAAYGTSLRPVPPVVVLILNGAPWALSGSHRLAALRRLYGPETYLDDLVHVLLLVDGEPVYEAASEAQRATLDRILAGRYSPADDLDSIRGLLPRRAQRALEGQ